MEVMNNNFESLSENDTFNFARKLAKECIGGEVYCLDGDLGVGKTVFTKGFACGLGIKEAITSPTFSIVNEYVCNSGKKLYHFDLYRLSSEDELYDIGFYEYINDSDAICLIEWGKLFKSELPENTKYITILKDLEKGLDYRKIEIR